VKERTFPAPWLTRPPVQLAGLGVLVAVLLTVAALGEQRRVVRETALEGEMMAVQLRQLARAVGAESQDLVERARGLAEFDAIARVVDERALPLSRSELGALLREADADALLLATKSGAVRLSVAMAGDKLVEETPDHALLGAVEALGSVVASKAAASDARNSASFVGGELVAAQPILARAAGSPVVGWIALRRSLAPRVTARLERVVTGALQGEAWQLAAQHPGQDLPTLPVSPGDDQRVSAVPSADQTFGHVIVRQDDGTPVWLFRLDRTNAAAAPATSGLSPAVIGVVIMAVALGVALFAVRRRLGRHRADNARYKAIIDQTHDGIVIVDAESYRILDANPAILVRLGYILEEALALSLADLFVLGESAVAPALLRLRDAGPSCAVYMQQRCKDSSLLDVEVRCNALDVNGHPALALVLHDVSVRRKAEQQLMDNQQRLDRMAHHDQLTGLPNRHYLAAFLPDAIAVAKAAKSMLAVVFIDLDRFKHINDTRGHETGDQLLQEVARRVRQCVRDSDVVIRMGGDEFVVVLRNVKSYEEANQGASRIIDTLSHPIILDRHPLQATASIGVSVFPRDGADMVELLKHSDTAMYQAKDRGRNNVQMFSPIMNRKLKRRVAVEASLREALRLKQLDVHYQPFVDLTTRKIVGLEALIRWRHPIHGMIPADQFIPVAEETGLVIPIGNFVLHRTVQTLCAWRNAGLAVVPISINVAPAQLQRGELHSTIGKLLQAYELDPALLQIEMTERAVFDHGPAQSGERRQNSVAQLRDLGIKIAIDDFGTGYSSLSYLKHWRVDALKIDRSFVRDLVTDSSDFAIVSAIVAIARHLRIDVIAEGVEGYQQAETLKQLGCGLAQGFLFARPMAAEQCVELLDGKAIDATEDVDMLPPLVSVGR